MILRWKTTAPTPTIFLGGTDDSYYALDEHGPWAQRMPHKAGPPLLHPAPQPNEPRAGAARPRYMYYAGLSDKAVF
jgi:hypothetical protein